MAEDFFSKYASDYGYGGCITAIREKEFPNLNDSVYLDHTGATLYAKSQMQSYHEDLMKNIYGNPHSSCLSSEETSYMIDDVRQEILSFFNTTSDEYYVLFTSNSTHGIKLVAENFQFHSEPRSCFVYLQDNHTSVVGIRAVALEKGVNVKVLNYQESSKETLSAPCKKISNLGKVYNHTANKVSINCDVKEDLPSNNLFAFPAMSNFSGHKYPLEWISSVQNNGLFSDEFSGKWFVLLDAASFVSTSELDLNAYNPDFVPISFYKMFGFPTGLGVLLVSARGAKALSKSYFGGGSVSAYSSDTDFHVFRPSLHDRHKDGTPPFLEILAVRHGFQSLRQLTTSTSVITKHTFCLAQYVYNNLKELKHYNENRVCECYCDTEFKSSSLQGPIVNFNILRSDGSYVGYAEVSKLAAIYLIHLRTGCFCNVGACQYFLKLTTEQLHKNFDAGHVCGDSVDIVDGYPTGSIRISFGYMSAFSDAEKFLSFIKSCFVDQVSRCCNEKTPKETTAKDSGLVKKMYIYPVKSCAAFEVEQWNLNEKGLCYDREWLIVNESGSFISQKREPRLCLIEPYIDLKENILQLQAPGISEFKLPINISNETLNNQSKNLFQPRICGAKVSGIDCGDDVSSWLTSFLKQKCRLIRQNPKVVRRDGFNRDDYSEGRALSLVNNSQLVAITETSCLDLLQNINSLASDGEACKLTLESVIKRFRPNLVISGDQPFEEESWGYVAIGGCDFQCCGVCFRCQTISVDPKSGQRSKEPMRTLARLRGSKIPFGVHLQRKMNDEISQICVGDTVIVTEF
ncbi:molybdenum cofactor sulfurase-like [Dendronephthya gigantea]|uniref:molybdenum cofactor sulfurase-like n=1 Tax=Dendronephthya gigantea TaxID=151771 RepID=UPI00106D1892|nr:molybdenum cofactor sulfurase-like [Dendronephthya gigantea]